MSTADVVALIATTLALGGAASQLRRLARTSDGAGVSVANALMGLASELGWLGYTMHEALWSAVPEVALMLTMNLLLAVALVRTGAGVTRPLAAATAWGCGLAAGAVLGGAPLLGLMLPLAYAIQVAPAVWSAYRTWAPSGVSTTTWALILGESVLWGAYGVIQRDVALTTFGLIGSASSAAIVVRMLATSDRVRTARDSRALAPSSVAESFP